MRMLVTAAAAALGITLSGAASASQAATVAGAYVGPGQSCGDVFVFRKGKASFKEPRNAFGSAFLLQGGSLRTPLATCKVGRRTQGPNGVTTLDLQCTNSMSSDSVKAYLRSRDDGSLMRLAAPDETSGDTYQHCGP